MEYVGDGVRDIDEHGVRNDEMFVGVGDDVLVVDSVGSGIDGVTADIVVVGKSSGVEMRGGEGGFVLVSLVIVSGEGSGISDDSSGNVSIGLGDDISETGVVVGHIDSLSSTSTSVLGSNFSVSRSKKSSVEFRTLSSNTGSSSTTRKNKNKILMKF